MEGWNEGGGWLEGGWVSKFFKVTIQGRLNSRNSLFSTPSLNNIFEK